MAHRYFHRHREFFLLRLKGKDDRKWNLALQELLQQTEY